MTKKATISPIIPALKLRQWLSNWDQFTFDRTAQQTQPERQFLLCSIKASHLKALTGVYRRSTRGLTPRAKDPNVQRGHEEKRSETIRQFVEFGFPWCEMGEAKRKMPGAEDLKKPGWLPTAILVNILPPKTVRNGQIIADDDLVKVEDSGEQVSLRLPKTFSGQNWEPKSVYPLEVIDGQHRLWAFEEFDPAEDFELPVVAFYGLDRGWQAYLFWSVNITPKRINRSLAFDLYPLLRQQSWLDKFAGHSIYRESRCQELVEAMWGHPNSPWHQRINMLGEPKAQREYQGTTVTQAAWVRSLMASLVKQSEGQGTKIGGLFGAPRSADELLLPWNRAMQAAFLITAGTMLREKVRATKSHWAKHLRGLDRTRGLSPDDDPAFYGEHSLLTTDQGIRGFLFIVNDLCYIAAEALQLKGWRWEAVYEHAKAKKLPATDEEAVTYAIASLSATRVANFLEELAKGLAEYDWRTSSTPGLSEEEKLRQSVFRGSGGYRELRRQLLLHLRDKKGITGQAAHTAIDALAYE